MFQDPNADQNKDDDEEIQPVWKKLKKQWRVIRFHKKEEYWESSHARQLVLTRGVGARSWTTQQTATSLAEKATDVILYMDTG